MCDENVVFASKLAFKLSSLFTPLERWSVAFWSDNTPSFPPPSGALTLKLFTVAIFENAPGDRANFREKGLGFN